MNCEECKEQVLDLIEREADDPEGVREVLERCPDCRALFDQMKTALQRAADLPIEAPPARLDEAVVAAARAHTHRVRPIARKRFRAPQWAAAAVTLLAIGIGVWSIPRDGEPSGDKGAARVSDKPASQALPFEPSAPQVTDSKKSTSSDDAAALASLETEATAVPQVAHPGRRATAEPRTAEKREIQVAGQAKRASASTADSAMLVEEDAPRTPATKRPRELSAACQEKLRAIEAQEREASPEDALVLGRCYREAGDFAEARRWFELATTDSDTRARAERALGSLPSN